MMLAASAGGTGGVLIELGVVLLLLAVLGRIAARVGIPSIPLYLLAGLAMGNGGLLPLEASDAFIRVGAEVGVVLLLLLLGLEYSAAELRDGLRANWPSGLLDLAVNAAPGIVAGFLLGWNAVGAIVLGAATYVSSSGIIAKLLGELDRIGNRETSVILSILVMEDLAMAVVLPVIGVLLVGTGIVQGSVTIVVALAVLAFGMVVSIRWGRHLSRLISARSPELLLLTILGATFLVAGLADEVQVSSAVGAFLIGVALSGPVAETGRELLTPMRDVFGGLFFVFFGLQVDPGSLPPVLLPAAGLAVVTALSKALTGWWAAGRSGIGRRGRVRAGLSLVPRGEFSIVVGGLAVAAGLDEVGPVTAAYVLLLAVLGSVAMRYADAVPLPARRHAAPRA